ncbi:hypothetical protein LY78DRAFT_709778 [Colletotrichum sublineola]|nr:hypothetical protein LY78DRAFT_709778 [Colletotrichum sublineola]
MNAASPKRYALLVGIDVYCNDGSRKQNGGDPVFLNNLSGCFNDVQAIKAFLHQEFQLDRPIILTSSLAAVKGHGTAMPAEPPSRWPTFHNIKREFDAVYHQARSGDFFYFHFSGHGAELQPIHGYANSNLKEPSLLTIDFCCGKPAVRGWQLNQWLERLSNKNVHVAVTLDSCHSGGAWRRDSNLIRTPIGWTTVLNLPVDEEAVEGEKIPSSFRGGELEKSWAINPDRFTVMTACESGERASEWAIDGRNVGAFTHALLDYLKEKPIASSRTYRIIRDQVANRISGQHPRVFSRDRLLFLGTEEPFSTIPLVARIEKGIFRLPTGSLHGVQRGSKFKYPSTGDVFTVDFVDKFQCQAAVSPGLTVQGDRNFQVFPLRWNFGTKRLQVLVDPRLGDKLLATLCGYLKERIASNVEVIQKIGSEKGNDDCYVTLRLEQRGRYGIDIFGPASVIGNEGPVCGIDIRGDRINLANISAIALTHLTRFKQVLDLPSHVSKETAPFDFTVVPENARATSPFSDREKFKFAIKNTGQSTLYITIMVLSSGFHVRQLYPTQDSLETLHVNGEKSFTFLIAIPDLLKREQAIYNGSTHRDIFRTIVIIYELISWRSLELPDIWNAARTGHELMKLMRNLSRKKRPLVT